MIPLYQNKQEKHPENSSVQRRSKTLPSLQQIRCRLLLQEVDEQGYDMCTGFKDGPMQSRK